MSLPGLLGKDEILRGLRRIDALAREAGVTVDLAIYGGAALLLVFDLRAATRDVDAVVKGDPAFLRRAAAQVAREFAWSEDWLNDGVKGFLSSREQLRALEEFAGSAQGGLRVYTPTPEYLFAMKCMAMRADGIDGSHDVADIEMLAEHASVADAAAALALVESFYPSGRIPAKVRFGVEEIMERVVARREKGL